MKACTGDHKLPPFGDDTTEYKFGFKTPTSCSRNSELTLPLSVFIAIVVDFPFLAK